MTMQFFIVASLFIFVKWKLHGKIFLLEYMGLEFQNQNNTSTSKPQVGVFFWMVSLLFESIIFNLL